MTWFFAVLVVALMGGVAVVAAGRGAAMAEAFDDRPDSRVPADGPLTAHDLRKVRFSTAFRGYRMSEVDALLDRLAAELEPARPEHRRDEPTLPAYDGERAAQDGHARHARDERLGGHPGRPDTGPQATAGASRPPDPAEEG